MDSPPASETLMVNREGLSPTSLAIVQALSYRPYMNRLTSVQKFGGFCYRQPADLIHVDSATTLVGGNPRQPKICQYLCAVRPGWRCL